MTQKSPSRVSQDFGDLVFVSGADSVLINNSSVVFEGSITASGSAVVTSSRSVLVENKGIARIGDLLNNGAAVRTGASSVCVGD